MTVVMCLEACCVHESVTTGYSVLLLPCWLAVYRGLCFVCVFCNDAISIRQKCVNVLSTMQTKRMSLKAEKFFASSPFMQL
jgi:hypothetical protein